MEKLKILSTNILDPAHMEIAGFSRSELAQVFERYSGCSSNPAYQILDSQDPGTLVLKLNLEETPPSKSLTGFAIYVSSYRS